MNKKPRKAAGMLSLDARVETPEGDRESVRTGACPQCECAQCEDEVARIETPEGDGLVLLTDEEAREIFRNISIRPIKDCYCDLCTGLRKLRDLQ